MNLKMLGEKGERLACLELKRKGCRVILRNYKSKVGEIDIVAKKGNTLIFVEVKTRLNKEFGEPFEAVNYFKQKRIRRIAEGYLQKNPLKNYEQARFDVISILFEKGKGRVEHIENAF